MTEHFAFALHVYYPYCPCHWPPSRPWVLHGRTIVDSCRCHLAQPAEELRPICNSKSLSSSSFHFTQGTAELCSGVSRIINWSISVKADMIYWCLHVSPNLFFSKIANSGESTGNVSFGKPSSTLWAVISFMGTQLNMDQIHRHEQYIILWGKRWTGFCGDFLFVNQIHTSPSQIRVLEQSKKQMRR